MSSIEELCISIADQLTSYDQRNAKLRRALQEENVTLRARLENLVRVDVPQDFKVRAEDLAYETPLPPFSPRVPSGCSTPRFRIGKMEANNSESEDDAHSTLPTTPLGEEDFYSGAYERESYKVSAGKVFFPQGNDCNDLVGAWAKWHKIISTMMNMSLFGVERSKLESALLLRPAWETTKIDTDSVARRSTVASKLTASVDTDDENDDDETFSMRTSSYSRFILHPDSKIVTVWSLLGASMIIYDILNVPLAGFDLDESDLQVTLMWITTLFWTSDIVVSFLRGVHHISFIEMRPARICWLYARSWLLVDLTMATVDWFVLYVTAGGSNSVAGASKVLRSGKALRAARVVRAIRLIRTIKFSTYLRDVFESIKSEYYQLLIKLWASIIVFLVLSHYITCSWFAQAHLSSNEKTWITVFLDTDPRPTFAVEYVTSMHFALTQLAGSQNIVPQNGMERFIASVIIVVDIVIFSTLVGIITDIMAQFRSLTYERSREVNLIRKFFTRSGLPTRLESRIWHFFRRHYRTRHRFVNESEIEFFQYLPSSLKMDLHQHLYIPVLSAHPLYNVIIKHDRYSMLAVCVTALTTATLSSEVEVFSEADIAKFMYFITVGIANYEARQFGVKAKIHVCTWVSEATIWTKWMHCGRLTAESSCEVVKVDADMFAKTIHERGETSEWFRGLRKYAALFAQRVSDSFDTHKPITDLDRHLMQLERIVDTSFSYMAALEIASDDGQPLSPSNTGKEGLLSPIEKIKTAMSSLSFVSHS